MTQTNNKTYLSHRSTAFEELDVVRTRISGVPPREYNHLAITVERQEHFEVHIGVRDDTLQLNNNVFYLPLQKNLLYTSFGIQQNVKTSL